MPSGAKKRKTAKEKKEKQSNHSSSATHSHVKHQEEKESDEGEATSPASHDHHGHQHSFSEGEEVKRESTSSVRSSFQENNSTEGAKDDGGDIQKVANEEEGVIEIEREMKPENEFDSNNVKIDGIRPARKSHFGGSSGSSSCSSSGDESFVNKTMAAVVDAASPVDSVEAFDSLSQAVTQVLENTPVGEAYNGAVDTVLFVDPDKGSKEEVDHLNESAIVDNSESSGVMELALKENGEKNLNSLVVNAEVSTFAMGLGSQKMEGEAVSVSEQNAAVLSEAKGSAVQENEDRLSLSFNASKVDIGNGLENAKDSKFPECSDNQPLVGSAPRPAQTTSWKGCCGLFELFTVSNR